MAVFQGLLFLLFGVGLLAVDWRALANGWLPCGPKGVEGRLEFRRDEQPFAFWFMFAVYAAAGLWLAGYALQLLAGGAEPLPIT